MVEAGSTTLTRRFCGLASASPQPNFPAEDKSHNLRVDVVDPIQILWSGLSSNIPFGGVSQPHYSIQYTGVWRLNMTLCT